MCSKGLVHILTTFVGKDEPSRDRAPKLRTTCRDDGEEKTDVSWHIGRVILGHSPHIQDHRGSISWVSKAFGARWAFVDAVWSLATSFLDNALYPIIIADFLGISGASRWIFVYATIGALSWAVYRGSAVSFTSRHIWGLNEAWKSGSFLYKTEFFSSSFLLSDRFSLVFSWVRLSCDDGWVAAGVIFEWDDEPI